MSEVKNLVAYAVSATWLFMEFDWTSYVPSLLRSELLVTGSACFALVSSAR